MKSKGKKGSFTAAPPGEPSRSDLIPLSRPHVPKGTLRGLGAILRGRHLAAGPVTAAFEAALEGLTAPEVVTVNSGTTALMLLLRALKDHRGRGEEVVVPAYCCPSVFWAVRSADLRPVVADTDPATFAYDAGDLKRRLTKKTLAVVVVHTFGTVNPQALWDLPFPIEDCAHTVGCRRGGRPVGALAEAAFFSFYATKLLHTAYGGAARAPSAIAARIRDYKLTDSVSKGTPRGYNVSLSDLLAFLGLAQLAEIDAVVAKRRRIARAYDAALAGSGLLVPRDYGSDACYRYVVRLAGTPIEEARAFFRSRGITANRPYETPLFLLGDAGAYPGAREIYDRVLALPLFYDLTRDEVLKVKGALRDFAAGL
ncbi:MAG TPA: DegT/DnrJ/EryC1/StrS aminotransferase family protein [Syntrophales bacterium]|nr:DegT/DnrJ/EryC1/StrS aminotransferase family protein [Syntrophales bacterium]HOM07674.1 DegT/DnrJ/EryC1/StrS aminotransferase family protein [Syntrophales bacterium]HOO00460.1 DegT/DnrJ/EryC1/StrS aminotransferase family protein [Syntrophales bacterium]HPC00830.1 DegT/DnrJ/EryC1/StrS aminotransferase family protein [Syntrophales bacterium]HPQ07403.1 DegT/DnrJ/EryC1/StrS aminotransferase family protein [Syntrophales bacterium]